MLQRRVYNAQRKLRRNSLIKVEKGEISLKTDVLGISLMQPNYAFPEILITKGKGFHAVIRSRRLKYLTDIFCGGKGVL